MNNNTFSAFKLGQQVGYGELSEEAARQSLHAQMQPQNCGENPEHTLLIKQFESGMTSAQKEEQKNPYRNIEVKGWPKATPAMFHGFAGEFAHFATEKSEADPVAVLATLLCRFGVETGRNPYMLAGDKQHARLNAVLVGQSSKARKGTSARPVKDVFSLPQKEWTCCRFSPGPLSSGEGLVFAVRDPLQEYILNKQKQTGQEMMTDPGVDDKRLFVLDQEFASALSCTRREGNTLSTIVRALFDGDTIEPLTKTSKLTATDPHIGIVTHVTIHELHKKLDATEALNGFANRFLWLCVRRPKLVPFPEEMNSEKLREYQKRLISILKTSQKQNRMRFTDNARELWRMKYPSIASDRPTLLGSILNRAEAYIRRIALSYALLDEAKTVDENHLTAAFGLWKFNEDSAAFIFGGFEADPVERRIVEALAEADGKMNTTALYKAFGNHLSKERLTIAMNTLSASRKIRIEEVKPEGGGRPRKIFHLCEDCEETNLLPNDSRQ